MDESAGSCALRVLESLEKELEVLRRVLLLPRGEFSMAFADGVLEHAGRDDVLLE